eukprot:scaffold228_cov312-Pinguiococcus_pyrenoidosus.AAC.56
MLSEVQRWRRRGMCIPSWLYAVPVPRARPATSLSRCRAHLLAVESLRGLGNDGISKLADVQHAGSRDALAHTALQGGVDHARRVPILGRDVGVLHRVLLCRIFHYIREQIARIWS